MYLDRTLLFGIDISFELLYTISRKVRRLHNGNIYAAKHNLTNTEYPVIVIDRPNLKLHDDDAVSLVVKNLFSKSGRHGPVDLVDFFQTPTKYYIVYQLYSVGKMNGLDKPNDITEKDPPFDILYTISRPLNSGHFATVSAAKYNWTQRNVAVKFIDRQKLKPEEDASVFREVEVLNSLKGQNGIIYLIDFFKTPTSFYLVTPLAHGGDLHERFVQGRTYTENEAKDISRKIIQALHYIHCRGIVHRDIKAANVLVMDHRNDVDIKIADFGFATFYRNHSADPNACGLKTICGTPAYLPPEIFLNKKYNHKVDMWSCGVLMYMLLGGYFPFDVRCERTLFSKICAADYTFHPETWNEISIEAQNLVSSLLTLNPSNRIDAGNALQASQWLNGADSDCCQGRTRKD